MFAVIRQYHFDSKYSAEIDRQVRDTGKGGCMLNQMSIGLTAAALLTALTLVGNASAEDARLGPGISPGGNIEQFASKEDEGLARLQDKMPRLTSQMPNTAKAVHKTAINVIKSMR